MEIKLTTKNFNETIVVGRKIIKNLSHPLTILLEGDLASGKTTLTKGFALEKGIKDVINSPSFTIMKEYITSDGISFHHYDFYRLDQTGNDFDLLDYLDYGYNIIEWPNQASELLPNNSLNIKFLKEEDDENIRHLIITSNNIELLNSIKKEFENV